MKGRTILLQRPPLLSPVRAGVSHVPSHNQAGFSLELTGLAHAAGPHHGDLDEPPARNPQTVVGSGAARGGVLGDGAHVLDEAHRRCGRADPRGKGSEDRSSSHRAETVSRTDAARPGRLESTWENDGTRVSAVPARNWDGRRPGADFFPAQAPPTPRETNPRAPCSRPRLRPAHRSYAHKGAQSKCWAP